MAIFLWLFIFFFFIHNTTGESIDGFKVVFDPRNTPFVQPEGGISTYVSQQKYSDELLVFNGPISEIDPNSAKPEFQVLARMSSPVRGIIDPNFPQDLKYSFKNMIPLLLHFHTKPLELRFNMKRLIEFQIQTEPDTRQLLVEWQKIKNNLSDSFRFKFYRVVLNVLQFFSTNPSSIISLLSPVTSISWLDHMKCDVISGNRSNDKMLKFNISYSEQEIHPISGNWNEILFSQADFDESPEIEVNTNFWNTFVLFVKYQGTFLKRVSRNKKLVQNFSLSANQAFFYLILYHGNQLNYLATTGFFENNHHQSKYLWRCWINDQGMIIEMEEETFDGVPFLSLENQALILNQRLDERNESEMKSILDGITEFVKKYLNPIQDQTSIFYVNNLEMRLLWVHMFHLLMKQIFLNSSSSHLYPSSDQVENVMNDFDGDVLGSFEQLLRVVLGHEINFNGQSLIHHMLNMEWQLTFEIDSVNKIIFHPKAQTNAFKPNTNLITAVAGKPKALNTIYFYLVKLNENFDLFKTTFSTVPTKSLPVLSLAKLNCFMSKSAAFPHRRTKVTRSSSLPKDTEKISTLDAPKANYGEKVKKPSAEAENVNQSSLEYPKMFLEVIIWNLIWYEMNDIYIKHGEGELRNAYDWLNESDFKINLLRVFLIAGLGHFDRTGLGHSEAEKSNQNSFDQDSCHKLKRLVWFLSSPERK